MTASSGIGTLAIPASHVLGRKLDSIPFSGYHLLVIVVLGLVALIDGYDGSMTGSLLVLAKQPLHITPGEIRVLAVAGAVTACIGGFVAAAFSDHWSRRTVMLLGVASINFFTLLIPLVQNAEQLIIVRLLTGLAGGFAASAAFPIAAELMPAQHRRTYGAIYEMMLASSFTLVLLVGFLLAGTPNGFRLMALPALLGLFVVPVLVYLLIPESPRWYLLRGNPQAAVEAVNRIIGRCGNRVAPLTVTALGEKLALAREELPSFAALFRPGQLRWTVVGILSLVCAQVSFFTISVLLPKALVDQGAAVGSSLGLSLVAFLASIPGKGFTGFLMEIIGRRWTITYCLAGSRERLVRAQAACCCAISRTTRRFSVTSLLHGTTALWSESASSFCCTCARRQAGVGEHSVQTTESGGPCCYDAGKEFKGRERHILTDTTGLLVGAEVHPADVQDRDGAVLVIEAIHLFADAPTSGKSRATCYAILVSVPSKSSRARRTPSASNPSPRWVVERPGHGSIATAVLPKTLKLLSPAPKPGRSSPRFSSSRGE
jgi:MFS family permease